MRIRFISFIALLFALGSTACESNSPEMLGEKLRAAVAHGDLQAAYSLLSSPRPPADDQLALITLVEDCSYGHECTVSPGPVTDEFKKKMAESLAKDGHVLAVSPEGLLNVQDSIKAKDGGSSSSLSLPFAKLDGKYRILTGNYSAEKLLEMRARSPQTITIEKLANGIDNDPTWVSKADKLAPDGGEAGKALVIYVTAINNAFKAKDFASLIVLAGNRGKFLYRDRDYDGTPVPEKKRELVLAEQFVQELTDVHVLGGYLRGTDAAVIFEGHDGAGWIMRGAYLMKMEGGKWIPRAPLAERLPPV